MRPRAPQPSLRSTRSGRSAMPAQSAWPGGLLGGEAERAHEAVAVARRAVAERDRVEHAVAVEGVVEAGRTATSGFSVLRR